MDDVGGREQSVSSRQGSRRVGGQVKRRERVGRSELLRGRGPATSVLGTHVHTDWPGASLDVPRAHPAIGTLGCMHEHDMQ